MTLTVTPSRAFYRPGEMISLNISSDETLNISASATIYHLAQRCDLWTGYIQGTNTHLEGFVSLEPRCGYLVHVQAGKQRAFTAFDVLDRWTDAPRYGFLYDFTPERTDADIETTLDHLLALHVNGLQFYDWQYRHDTLLPLQEVFTDPLGRVLSLGTVRTLIDSAHQRGISAMPYTAIYGASPAFAAAHADWQLYDEKGTPIDFADGFLKIMNPRSEWQAHFVQECRQVLDALTFDGIHVDQYGDPMTGFDASGAPVDIPTGFAETLASLRDAIGPDRTLLFNLVHNWPVESIAHSPLDFWYSELWPPETTFKRLWQTIHDNRELNRRSAVLAVYIPPDWENTVVAAQSTILAAGGTHIAHGDHRQYLSDPYFPKASYPSAELAQRLQQLADFAVAYENALSFAEDVTTQWTPHIRLNDQPINAGQLIVHCAGKCLFVNLLNNVGKWDAQLSMPERVSEQHITVPNDSLLSSWYCSPANPLPQAFDGHTVPSFSDWLLICYEFEESIPCLT